MRGVGGCTEGRIFCLGGTGRASQRACHSGWVLEEEVGFEKAQVHASIAMGVVPTLLSSLAILVFILVTSPLPLSHRL